MEIRNNTYSTQRQSFGYLYVKKYARTPLKKLVGYLENKGARLREANPESSFVSPKAFMEKVRGQEESKINSYIYITYEKIKKGFKRLFEKKKLYISVVDDARNTVFKEPISKNILTSNEIVKAPLSKPEQMRLQEEKLKKAQDWFFGGSIPQTERAIALNEELVSKITGSFSKEEYRKKITSIEPEFYDQMRRAQIKSSGIEETKRNFIKRAVSHKDGN